MLVIRKNILVISVNTWNDEAGANTLQNLFRHFESDNIYSLYARSDLPNSRFCSRFYQIREISLFKRIFSRTVKVGNEVKSFNSKGDRNTTQEAKAKKIYSSINNSFFTCLRELLWNTNTWKEDTLRDYIFKANIDTIFVLVSSFVYSNRIALYVKELVPNAKIVMYFVDDNYTYQAASKSLFGLIHRYCVRKTLNKLVKNASHLFVISSKMKEEYDLYFNRQTTLLTKGVNIDNLKVDNKILLNTEKIKLLYVGNLLYGRFEEMCILAEHVDELTKKYGDKIQFDIYTQTILSNRNILLFNSFANCTIHKSVPYSQVNQLQEKYDILIYAESFKKRYRRATRLSFSTKVTDYLSSGKVIWAIGPEQIASIDYFKKNNCALVSTSRESVQSDIEKILLNPTELSFYAKNAVTCCQLYHDEKVLASRFVEAMK